MRLDTELWRDEAPGGHEGDRRMALADEWDELVEQVRRIDGFEDFLRPPRLTTLLRAAAEGPVAIVNVSRWRCDSLVVRPDGVDVVPLPKLSSATVGGQVQEFLRVVHQYSEESAAPSAAGGTGSPSRDVQPAVRTLEQRLAMVLGWCWDAIAEPILDHLGYTDSAPSGAAGRRLWWCPTGPLTVLPLHAAGRHDVPGAAVIDRVISSYTPTLRALREARRRPEVGTAGDAAALIVGMPTTPNLPDLPNVAREIEVLTRLLPDTARSVLVGPTATVSEVRQALATHRWAHFSCHGDQNLTDPSRGGVLLHDGRLTIADLAADQYQGDFVFLSACKTATGGTRLPDEAITLAAALHYAGYRHVIATLWSVWDASAADIAAAVYPRILTHGVLHPERSAHALHDVVRAQREAAPDSPSVWAPFIHIGP